MARKRKQNIFAAKKRMKRENDRDSQKDRPTEPYKEIIRENEAFIKYYRTQNICSSTDEWDYFMTTIRDNLPTTFRVTGFKEEANALLDVIETQLFTKDHVEQPLRLPWYPNGMAFQLQLSRKDIRRSEQLYRLHNFLIAETNAGNISRQEAVSMIPPLVLDVQPTDKVLDMCAAPGSKTAQLIEALHISTNDHKIPPGFIVANDVDNNRCYMLVHQAKRLNSPCFVVTNHDSCFYPNLLTTQTDGTKGILKFNKILCDVPCSGDGTLRKNPDIWNKWNLAQSYNLHGLQYRIVRRGVEMLDVGGRLVYSTCSLNPIENEAVLQRIIADSEGALQIIDASSLVPGLKYQPGMTNWKLTSREVDEVYNSFNEVPEKYYTIIRPNMFPLPSEEIEKIGLDKCIRILPHYQNTGAFFVAVIEKKHQLPFEKNDIKDLIVEESQNKNTPADKVPITEKIELKRKRRRLHGYKEDPYVFFSDSDPDWIEIKNFYGLSDSLNKRCFLTRCISQKKKNIYYCSEPIRDLVILNEDAIKIINTGVKTFVRCENRHTTHSYRLAQEGLQTLNAFMDNNRRIDVQKADLILLLNCTDPTKPPSTTELQKCTEEQCKKMGIGSCILKYLDARFVLYIVGWRGTSSLRAYVDSNEAVHILRLLGADISKFQTNKFLKAKETEEVNNDDDAEKE